MHGNVWEWTRSAERAYPYEENDGRNDLSATGRRVVRGGSWYDRPKRCTSSFRLGHQPYQKVFNTGFRVICQMDLARQDRITAKQDVRTDARKNGPIVMTGRSNATAVRFP